MYISYHDINHEVKSKRKRVKRICSERETKNFQRRLHIFVCMELLKALPFERLKAIIDQYVIDTKV